MFTESQKAIFWARTNVLHFNRCWNFQGEILRHGYGQISLGYKRYLAHMVSYLIFNGNYDRSLYIDHICRNRACVNPKHLRLVTPRQNALENNIGPVAANYKKTHCKYGHEFTIENTIILLNNKYPRRRCSICMSAQQKRARNKIKCKKLKNQI